MEIRKLKGSERFDAHLISTYCFHERVEDVERDREKIEKETVEDWGAFAEDGTLTARIVNNKFNFYIDGTPVRAGGIGAVSTLPEYRAGGAIRKIFQELLPEAYRDGEVISTLYPFNHAFYRKQGYETIVFQNDYEFTPAVLSGYRYDGKITRWNPGEPVTEYLDVYNRSASGYNLALLRDEKTMLEHMKVDKLYQERKFSYLFRSGKENIAYITFSDIKMEPAPLLRVEESAWVNREGFEAIPAFLARFEADYGQVRLPMPAGIDLLRLLRSPKAYEVRKISHQDFMVRVVNAGKLLSVIRKPAGCDFTIQVSDELLPENNGTWQVTAEAVKAADKGSAPDIVVSEKALGQLAVGGINLDEAMLRPDVRIHDKEELLRDVFREKKIFAGEHF